MNQPRRHFLRQLAAGWTAAAVELGSLQAQAKQARRVGAARRRRIVYNDDGDAAFPPVNPRASEGPKGFLSARFAATVKSQVDSYWWCVGDGQHHAAPWVAQRPEWKIPKVLGDVHQVIVEAAHRNKKEIFASLRMNDTHDALHERLAYPLKVQHPEYLIAPHVKYERSQIEYFVNSALNYAFPEVRQHRLEFIGRVCRQYDFDGFEMDFMRHAAFFRIGEEKKHVRTMTEFVRTVRALLRQIGKERGRPYLLAARVADTPELSLSIGLDTESWLKEGLLDLLVAGAGYAPFTTPAQEYISLGHRYGLPVYPCANYSMPPFDHPEAQLGMATNFFAAGADGIYLFNAYGVVELRNQDAERIYGRFREIGDPAAMRFKDKLFVIDSDKPAPHMARVTAPFQLPLGLSENRVLRLMVGEDLSGGAAERLKEIRLRLTTLDASGADVLVQVNGQTLKDPEKRITAREGERLIDFYVPPAVLKKRANTLRITSPETNRGSVNTVHLWVRYLKSAGDEDQTGRNSQEKRPLFVDCLAFVYN